MHSKSTPWPVSCTGVKLRFYVVFQAHQANKGGKLPSSCLYCLGQGKIKLLFLSSPPRYIKFLWQGFSLPFHIKVFFFAVTCVSHPGPISLH